MGYIHSCLHSTSTAAATLTRQTEKNRFTFYYLLQFQNSSTCPGNRLKERGSPPDARPGCQPDPSPPNRPPRLRKLHQRRQPKQRRPPRLKTAKPRQRHRMSRPLSKPPPGRQITNS